MYVCFMPTTATYKKICKLDYTIPATVSPEAADLIRKVILTSYFLSKPTRSFEAKRLTPCCVVQLLRYNPQDRLPLKEVAVHPWIKKYEKRTSSAH